MEFMPIEDLLRDRLLNALKLFEVSYETFINPRCPLSKKLLVNPCISIECPHVERVELRTFLEHSFKQNDWECPYCETKTYLKDIYIDFVLRDALLDATEETEYIKIFPNRSYQILSYINDQHRNLVLLTWSINQGRLAKQIDIESNNGAIETSLETIRLKTYTTFSEIETKNFSLVRSEISNSSSNQFSVPDVFWFPPDDTDTHLYSFEKFSWSNLPHIPNISNFLLDFGVVYTEKWTYIIGGVNRRLEEQNYCCRISKNEGLYKIESMMIARHRFAYALMENSIYVIGGLSKGEPLLAVEYLDLDTLEWNYCSPINYPRAGAVAAAINEETIELIGGTSEVSVFVMEIEEYRKSIDEWIVLSVDIEEGIIGGVAFNIPETSSILILGGYDENGPSNLVWMFNRSRLFWSSDLPKLKKKITDHWQFPVVYDKFSRFIHLFSGVEFPIFHIFYSINFLVEQLMEEEMDRDESTAVAKNENFFYI